MFCFHFGYNSSLSDHNSFNSELSLMTFSKARTADVFRSFKISSLFRELKRFTLVSSSSSSLSFLNFVPFKKLSMYAAETVTAWQSS